MNAKDLALVLVDTLQVPMDMSNRTLTGSTKKIVRLGLGAKVSVPVEVSEGYVEPAYKKAVVHGEMAGDLKFILSYQKSAITLYIINRRKVPKGVSLSNIYGHNDTDLTKSLGLSLAAKYRCQVTGSIPSPWEQIPV